MKPLTGRKVLAIAIAAFLVILTPNLVLAWFAVTTFSGLVVPNSYVASQTFDERRIAQEALGWTLSVRHEEGMLRLDLADADGAPVRPARLDVTLGRPTTAAHDRLLDLRRTSTGFDAAADLEPGAWLVLVEAEAEDGTLFKQRHSLHVRRPR
jgi:nitrogen fixation protein FixH